MKLSKQRAMASAAKSKLSNQNVVEDSRFSRLHTDPRFQRPVKRKLKIPIDARFGHIFSDRRFADPLALDKRGRKIRKSKQRRSRKGHTLHQYYHLDNDGDETVEENHSSGKLVSDKPQNNGNHLEIKRVQKNTASQSSDNSMDAKDERFIKASNSHWEADVKASTTGVEGNLFGCPEIQCNVTPDSEEDSDANDVSEESSVTASTSSSSNSDTSDEEDTAFSPSEEAQEENVPITENETRRLAVVNMDWDHIRAVDILAMLNSFLPKGGQIVSVKVFPSDFGLQQMKEEEKRGPQGLFYSESSDEDEEDSNEGLINERLRQYEKDKLRYYYAVVECDSKGSAEFLYKSCDGMEFERTSNTLDLRFIPDDMKFSNEPRDYAMEVPLQYQPPKFETRSLQHSRVKLTWDNDEPDRVKTLHQKFNANQLNDMDFKAYLASDGSDTEASGLEEIASDGPLNGERDLDDMSNQKTIDGRKDSQEKYRELLLGSEEVYQVKDKKSNNQDMEITFNSGLEDLSKRLMDKNKQKENEETVWEAYLRKKKEKRKLQKQQSKKAVEHEDDITDGQNVPIDTSNPHINAGFNDPFFSSSDEKEHNLSEESESEMEIPSISARDGKNGAHALKKKNREEEERSRAELELLFADELASGSLVKGYNLKKNRKKKNTENFDEKLPTANYEDPRFSAVFTSHSFALDTTGPEFGRSAAQLRLLLEKQRKCLPHVKETADNVIPKVSKIEDINVLDTRKEKQELSMMVRSLKRKMGGSEIAENI